MTLDIPAVPLITARFGGDHSGELSVDGVREAITAETTEHLREEILARVTAIAGELGRPVQLTTEDEEGQWLLVVHPDGEIGEEERIDLAPPEADAPPLVHAHLAGVPAENHDSEPATVNEEHAPDQFADDDAETEETPDAATLLADFLSDDSPEDTSWHIDYDTAPRPVDETLEADEPAHEPEPVEAVVEPADESDPVAELAVEPADQPADESDPVAKLAVEPADRYEPVAEPIVDHELVAEPERVDEDSEGVDDLVPQAAPQASIAPAPELTAPSFEDLVAAEAPQRIPPPPFLAEPAPIMAEPEPEPEPAEPEPATPVSALHVIAGPVAEPVAEPEPAAPPAGRASFLADERRPDRAKKGWRGFLAKTGLPIAASPRELEERSEIHAVSQHWAGPRTIAIVNGKGGANKTPTTAMLAAVFARNGGSGVLAWDNNETRGTLGWRTEQGTHDATVQTLLPSTDHLLSPSAQSSDLSHFVHHQTGDKYDVLRSNPTMLAMQQRITTDDFDRLHSVAAKYFRLIFIDSGNDESAERWLRMIDHTDQLVIATTALGEHAEAGALLLEALAQRDERSARLASGAVVVVSQSEKTGSLEDARRVAAGFDSLARRAVPVPYDTAMHGGRLEYSALTPASRRAWLHAAAAVAEGL